jgi:hypothetical protein
MAMQKPRQVRRGFADGSLGDQTTGDAVLEGPQNLDTPLRLPDQALAHNTPVIADLGEWRVRNIPLQWCLEHWGGKRWRERSHCRTKIGLLGCVREYVGGTAEFHPALQSLPEYHGQALAAEVADLEAEAAAFLEAQHGKGGK